jgi:hypothetical protein
MEKEHENYSRWRNKEALSEDEKRQRRADEAWAQGAYAKAYDEWLGSTSTIP